MCVRAEFFVGRGSYLSWNFAPWRRALEGDEGEAVAGWYMFRGFWTMGRRAMIGASDGVVPA